MPAAQGVLKWPTGRPALAALVDEFSMPLPEAAVDRVLLVHALEMSDDPSDLLREVWRVLAPSGRLIAVIPNRRGLWVRTDNTPFGFGRPYSRSQVTQLLRETWFTPVGWSEALPDRQRRLAEHQRGSVGFGYGGSLWVAQPSCRETQKTSETVANSLFRITSTHRTCTAW